ncbi:MAG: PAS domain S-box protein [Methanomicrobiaceae archaeon]|nr:PAS domain S-box protein [Methanomicrobiaceae archaeon]
MNGKGTYTRKDIVTEVILGIVLFTLVIAEIILFVISDNFTIVITHFFYFPVVFAAFHYPRRGVMSATIISFIYLGVFWYVNPPTMELLTAAMQFYVYVSVGLVVSSLSSTIRINELKYRNVFDNSGSCICLIDAETGMVRESNSQCQPLFGGLNKKEAGESFFDYWTDVDERATFFGRLREERTVCEQEITLTDSGGRQVSCLITGGTLMGDTVILILTDITARKRAEDTLRESEHRFRELADLLPQAVFELDLNREITFANKSGIETFGYTASDVAQGINADQIMPEHERQRMHDNLLRRTRGEASPNGVEYTGLRKDGTTFPAMIYLSPILKNDEIIGFRGIFVDISERKSFENALAVRNSQLSIINIIIKAATSSCKTHAFLTFSLAQILGMLDFDAGAIYLTESGTQEAGLITVQGLTDVEKAEFDRSLQKLETGIEPYHEYFIRSQPAFSEVTTTDDESSSASSLRIFARKIGMKVFAAIPLSTEERTVGVMFIASRHRSLFSEEEKAMIITLGRELASAILQNTLRKELEQSNTEANLYLDIMAHDLNNINTISLGYAEILAGLIPEGAPSEYIHKILSSVQQSAKIIDNVSTIRKIRDIKQKIQPVPLDEIIRADIKNFSDVHIDFTPSGAVVCANELLSEVFTNLITNSRKFGGDDVRIAIGVEKKDKQVIVSVSDTGPGMPDKSRIFNRFETGNSSRSGKGLGLSICRMLIESYGGRIWAEDRIPGHPGEGMTICFTLNTYQRNGVGSGRTDVAHSGKG